MVAEKAACWGLMKVVSLVRCLAVLKEYRKAVLKVVRKEKPSVDW